MPAALLSDVGVSASCMTHSLHSANILARANVSVAHNAIAERFRHKGGMMSRWKNHIAACRLAADMTMEQLAAAMDPPSSKGMISLYESGKRRPRQSTLEAIAKALGRTPGELIDGRQEGFDVPSAAALEGMISLAMRELPVGATNEDYQRVVASSLHAQLEQLRAVGGFRADQAASSAPGKAAQSHPATKRDARAGSRTP